MKSDVTIKKNELPKITFGIIVLNGEPFIPYCLRSIYPFAHEIIVVEGGHEDAKSVCTSDGHSSDSTLKTLYKFKDEEDSENKLTIVTRNGFWPKKDELGRDRTPQSRAYAEIVTGDYLWQIDIDEFYKKEDMISILKMLYNDPSIAAISFKQKSFWGGIDYISESYALLRNKGGWNRIFKWGNGYKYLTHEPPTVLDEKGIDLHKKRWISGEIMKRKRIYMYHYSLLFPWQVKQKAKVYRDEKPEGFSELVQWSENNYFKLGNPTRVHNIYQLPSWLERFKGTHPEQVTCMMSDINEGKVIAELRRTDDIEQLLKSKKYHLHKVLLKIGNPLEQILTQLYRVKNIPNRIRKIRRNIKNKSN
jgi:glycosyltransferase involved in cell wall biosynthesis